MATQLKASHRVTRPARARPAPSMLMTALAGAVFLGLVVAHAQWRRGAPSATDPGDDVLSYLTHHQNGMQFGAVALAFAMPAALVWLAGLVRALRRPGSESAAVTALGGGILAAASTVTAALVQGMLANRVDDLDPAGARVWLTLFLLSIGAIVLGLAVVIGATAVVALRTALFARWFAVASVVLALFSAAGAFTIGYDGDAIQTVAGAAVLLDSIWICVAGVLLARGPRVGREGSP